MNSDNREKIIQIITSSKEIIPYGKIVSTHSLDNAPENKFFFEKKANFTVIQNKKLFPVKTMKIQNIYI